MTTTASLGSNRTCSRDRRCWRRPASRGPAPNSISYGTATAPTRNDQSNATVDCSLTRQPSVGARPGVAAADHALRGGGVALLSFLEVGEGEAARAVRVDHRLRRGLVGELVGRGVDGDVDDASHRPDHVLLVGARSGVLADLGVRGDLLAADLVAQQPRQLEAAA